MNVSTRNRFLWGIAVPVAAVLILVLAVSAHAQDAAAAATAPSADATSAGVPSVSLFELFRKAGYFIYPLAACSVLSVALIIERLVSLRRAAVIPSRFLPGLKTVYRDPREDRDAALAYCRNNDSPISRVVAAAIKRMPRGLTAAEKAMEDAGANEALRLRRNMRFLYALGSTATLLGLIGTIWGMIQAFQATAAAGEGANKVQSLSTGIYEAMVNTFAGLAIAIIVTVAYYFFVGRIERLISELSDAAGSFADDAGFNVESEEPLHAGRGL